MRALVGAETVMDACYAHRRLRERILVAAQRSAGSRGDDGNSWLSFNGRIHGRLGRIWSGRRRCRRLW